MADQITLRTIQQAAEVLQGVAQVTPVVTSHELDERAGASVFLKCENFQRVGAFKFRGAYHAISRLAQTKHDSSVVTVSSGNHAQGVALACRLLGFEAHVVMPQPINAFKRQAVAAHGAAIYVEHDRVQAEERATALVTEKKGAFIHPFNDPHVIAGQGTVALELLTQTGGVDAVLGPVGGGGLLSGVSIGLHGAAPDTKIYACEPAGALDAVYSVRENRIVPMTAPATIADGLRTSLGDLTLPILRDHLEGFFVVDEQEIVEAMRYAFERLKMVIEPSSAVALAPLLRGEPALRGKRVGVILTGGNVDARTLLATVRDGGG
jgi:threonine dehydratase